MAMTRRGFLGWLATGAVSACVLAKIPTAWVPEPVRRYAAVEFMRTAYNDWSGLYGEAPDCLRAGTALFEAYESEIVVNLRFTTSSEAFSSRRSLMFKATPLWEDATLAPWDFELEGQGHRHMAVRMRPTGLRRAA